MAITLANLIDESLWSAAKWKETAFLVGPDFERPPGIGLMFENLDKGSEILKQWREILGSSDPKNLLRVSIIEGEHPKKGLKGYTVFFSTNAENTTTNTEYVAAGCKWKFKDTGGNNEKLDWFKESFKRHKKYFIVALPTNVSGSIGTYLETRLDKNSVNLLTFPEIKPTDVEQVVLG